MFQVIVHPNFTCCDNLILNDIALIKLNTSTNSEQFKNIVPICISSGLPFKLNKSSICYVTGWGSEHEKDPFPSFVLQQAQIPIFDYDDCIVLMREKIHVGKTVCAGGLPEGGKGICNGDSGGPLQCKTSNDQWYQVGISSWGNACARKGWPDVYTQVTAFNHWIEEIIKSN